MELPPTEMVNVIPELGVCYYPEHWDESLWAQDAAEMVTLGLKLVRIGEFAWSRLEPFEGQFEFDWLDRAISVLGQAGLKIILGTPSATPPRWVIDKFPDMLAYDKQGQPRKFGSRRHYCFSHEEYRHFSANMAGCLAKRYASNPFIQSWQIDNEYGCHHTILSYSENARQAFRIWLKAKYKTPHALNVAWGNIFWSMEYQSFDEIDLPNQTVTEANPSHWLDFYRFSSDQVGKFNKAQCEAIRQYCNKPLIHNYMGRITDFDHYKIGEDLDMASWDSYPLGFLEDRSDKTDGFRQKFQRQGDPDFQAFHHDLYRSVGRGNWGIMEQQPGAVNWAPYNPAPLPGMVRLWSWEAVAHGAKFVNYFRWRQASFAQEQMHSGLKRPDNNPTLAYEEIKKTAQELLKNSTKPETKTALVFDYESAWAWHIQPNSQDFDYFRLVYEFYLGLRRLGQNIDIVSPHNFDVNHYANIIIPGLFTLSDSMIDALKSFDGTIILGPRTDSKTESFHIATHPLASLGLNISTLAVETLRTTERVKIKKGGAFKIWREMIESPHKKLLETDDGYPAVIKHGKYTYLCGWPEEDKLIALYKDLLSITDDTLPDNIRRRDFGDYTLFTNYSTEQVIHEKLSISGADIKIINRKTNEIII